jgi:hypothetical protein
MLARLFGRFGSLRLAVAPQEVPLRAEMSIYGVSRLSVTGNSESVTVRSALAVFPTRGKPLVNFRHRPVSST